MSELTFKQWWKEVEAFRTPTFYLMLFEIAIVVLLNFAVTGLIPHIADVVAIAASGWVIGDLAAHTFWNGWTSDMDMHTFLTQKLFRRTHDIDGELIIFLMLILMVIFDLGLFFQGGDVTLTGVLTGLAGLSVLVVVADLIYRKFYH